MLEGILRTACNLDPSLPVLAGVSGGPDSLCLLDILNVAGYRVVVAHFNHKLRPEADREAVDVAGLARSLGLDFVSESADVAAYAGSHGQSVEEAARLLRYRFLFAAARQRGAQAVAVGHTADDQVETVLMHFLRGAGLPGLKGMDYRTMLPVFDPEIPLVRPLLSIGRAGTEAYCREHGLRPHFDPSNADQTYFRNRLRHALIPELEKYNPRFKEALLHTAAALQADAAILQPVVEAAWKDVFRESAPGWFAFDQPGLAALPAGLRRHLIRRAAEALRPEARDFGFPALERAAGFAADPGGKQVDFINGLYLFTESGKTYLAAYEADLPTAHWPRVLQLSSVGSEYLDLGEGWVLSCEEVDLDDMQDRMPVDTWSAWLDADRIPAGLTVRPRRPGDRFQPLGMATGSLKLSDFFVNVKLPLRARAAWPLVCVGETIAWVPGFRLAHPFRVTEKTKRVIRLSVLKNRADT